MFLILYFLTCYIDMVSVTICTRLFFFGGVSVVAALNPLMAALVDRLRTVWWGAAAQGAAIPFH